MIDPITAFAVAQGAIKGIQAAIKMGKDVQGITNDVMKFFDAKDKVAKEAVKDPKKKVQLRHQPSDEHSHAIA